MRKIVCTGLLMLAVTPSARAQDAAVVAQYSHMDEAVRTFATTCLAHVFSHVDLNQKYDHSPDALHYTDAQAAPFLEGHAGAVWGMRGHTSNYALVLQDNGICSLDAQTPVAGVWDDFDAMLKLFFPGMELVPVSPAMAGPTNATTKSKGYRLRIDSSLLPPVFTLTVSTDPKVNFAARLTLYYPLSAPQP